MRRTFAFRCALASLGCAPFAHAAENEMRTGVSVSVPFAPGDAGHPLFYDLQAEYGLSEAFAAGLELGAAHDEADFSLTLLRVTPLFVVRLDVVEWVPYLESGPTLVLISNSGLKVDGGADVVAGLDYLLSRSWSLGAQYHFTATLAGEGALLHRAGLRMMYSWGW